MITTAIRATMRPYSMAVAPDSSFTKRVTNLDMLDLLGFASRLMRDQAVWPARPRTRRQFDAWRLMASKHGSICRFFSMVYSRLLLSSINHADICIEDGGARPERIRARVGGPG